MADVDVVCRSSTSSNTRVSGSPNEVAVYSMRAVWSSRPHPHASVTRTGLRWTSRRAGRPSRQRPTSPSANSPGASMPGTPGSPTCQPWFKGRGWRKPVTLPAASTTAGMTRKGATPKTRLRTASRPAPVHMAPWTSLASHRPFASGQAEEPDADGLGECEGGEAAGEGEHADADGHRHRDRHVRRGETVQHALEEEPLTDEAAERRQGGDGEAAHQEDGAAHRHPSHEAAQPVEVRAPGRLLDRAGGEEQRTLEDGMEDDVQQRGDQRHQGRARCPVEANRPEAPTPSSMRPTLSVVE